MCYQVMLHLFMAAESVSGPVHENVCEDKVNEFCVSALIQYSKCFVAPFAAFPFAGRQNSLFLFFGWIATYNILVLHYTPVLR